MYHQARKEYPSIYNFQCRSEGSDDYEGNDQLLGSSPRKRSIKRPSAFRDYITEEKESSAKYVDNEGVDENEEYLVGKVQKAYQNLKRIQIVSRLMKTSLLFKAYLFKFGIESFEY